MSQTWTTIADGSTGIGPVLTADPRSLDIDVGADIAVILDNGYRVLLVIDLQTGERALIAP